MQRRDKNNYYLDIAQTVAERGTCLRRNFGAIVVKDDSIISTGYNGAPRGRKNCSDLNRCVRDELKVPHGERYELCRAVHAEANAIISAGRKEMLGATLYLACINAQNGKLIPDTCCCSMCKRLVINSGISNVVVRDTEEAFRVIEVRDWVFKDDSIDGESGY